MQDESRQYVKPNKKLKLFSEYALATINLT